MVFSGNLEYHINSVLCLLALQTEHVACQHNLIFEKLAYVEMNHVIAGAHFFNVLYFDRLNGLDCKCTLITSVSSEYQ